MRPLAVSFVALSLVTGIQIAQAETTIDYPAAKRDAVIDIYHDQEVRDPYRWLENMTSPETIAYVDAQEALLESYVSQSSVRDAMQERILKLTGLDTYSAPMATDTAYFYLFNAAGRPLPIVYVQSDLKSEPRVLLDVLEEHAGERRLAGIAPSPIGKHLAYGLSQGQSRWRNVHVRDVSSSEDLTEELTGLHALGGPIAWLHTGEGFFYSRFETPEAGQELATDLGASQVWYHRLNTPQSEDVLIFDRPDHPESLYSLSVTLDDAYLVISAYEGGDTKTEVFYADLYRNAETEIKTLIGEADATYTFLGSEGNQFWFYTTLDAPNGRILSIDLDRPGRDDWVEIVAESAEAIAGGSSVGGNAISMVKDALIIMYLKESRPLVRVFGLDGKEKYELEIPGIGAIWGGFVGRADSSEVFYSYLSLTDPNVIYRLDVEKGLSEVFKRPGLPFDPGLFTTTHTFYESKDGARVPIFVTHRKDIELDGSNPAFMYGYGAYGWVAFPWYQPHVMAWLEEGGVYAIPGIRGGGEYGEAWHQAGIRRNKQNGIDDYIAAAEWLIDSGYTSPSKMVANGGSASGMLAAAAVMQQPDLFGAGIIDIPALDLLRYEDLSVSRAWTDELGSVTNAEDFAALKAYSPYHNIKAATCYPPILVIVGEKDETVVPAHGYKFIAELQNTQACAKPAMLKVVRGAGHSYGTTPQQVAKTWADAWTFLEESLPETTQ